MSYLEFTVLIYLIISYRFGEIEYFDVKNIPEKDLKYAILELNRMFKLGMPDQKIKDF